ncbi:acyl-CoA carboxylase subunit beta [Paraperlucidibaca sp.]|jgi:geranyl-CoA carboxylase beta subunit|uniref:acyl-CoA carboxylase subunit beta n=1 Tax=Paraperlucidibaca sp. TaxID=2708021 RepID=UPI001B5296D7|nr:acyl-CoA carboxylase subunit beta [Paraperlucidibaca sp.]|tara:strand:- start:170 stop:1795 length:1626 start_codon:yes stop_codon:yes gene_type:complete
MTILESRINPQDDTFKANREGMFDAINALRAVESSVIATEEKVRAKYHKRGQMLPRERVHLLLDRGSPFMELSTLCGYKMHDDKDGSLAGGNTIAGIGYVEGVRCLIVASNSAIKGGTMTPFGVQKTLRLQEIALQQKLPVVSLIESGGANLMYQAELFIPGGKTFANQARLSAAGIPQVTVVHGSSTAGGAYMPGLSDYVVMVRKKAKVFLAGPPLLLAATGEIAIDEDLGGAEMHTQQAGTAEFLAESDADGIRIAREIVRGLHWNADKPDVPRLAAKAPRYDIDELCGVVSSDYRKPFDCREVIARLVDDSEFLEFKSEYDKQTVCGRAVIDGHAVGIISNNGPITTAGATKAGQFIQLCCHANVPIIYLMNTTGYMVGTASEQGGIVKHGSKMIQAVANATVPQITLVMGGSFGAGNYGMCGRGFGPHFIFAWPNSRTAVMGGEQAAKVMSIITREKWIKQGKEIGEQEEGMLKMLEMQIINKFDEDSHPFAASARLFDDGIIDPRDSRRALALTLSVCRESQRRELRPNSFGVARF